MKAIHIVPTQTLEDYRNAMEKDAIRITDEKLEDLRKYLAVVQTGREQNDILAERLLTLPRIAERALDLTGLAQEARPGARFTYADAGASNEAHRFAYATTRAVLRRDEHGWVLADRYRTCKFPGAPSDRDLELSEAQASMLPGKLKDVRYLRFEDGELSRMW